MFKITARLKEIQSNHSRAEAANVINTLRCQLEAFQRFFKKCLKKEKTLWWDTRKSGSRQLKNCCGLQRLLCSNPETWAGGTDGRGDHMGCVASQQAQPAQSSTKSCFPCLWHLPGFSRQPWWISRDRGVSLIQQELGPEPWKWSQASSQPLLGLTQGNHQHGAGIYPNIFLYHNISSFLTWTFGTAALAGGCNWKVKAAPKWERNGKLISSYVRKITQRIAFGGMDFGLWVFHGTAAPTEFSRACRAQASQASTSSDRKPGWTGTNFQTFHSAVEKPSVLRPQGMESGQDALQDTHSTQELPWDCSSTASTPCSLWSLQENCSEPLQSHFPLMPG